MSVPKKRAASRAKRTRAAHHALSKVTTVNCAQCKKAIKPHTACPFCGNYKGRNVLAKKATVAKAKPAPAKASTKKVAATKSSDSK